MRRVFLLLLLLNVVFFFWQVNRDATAYDPYADRLKPAAREMQGVRTIYLLAEIGHKPREMPPSVIPVPEIATLTELHCMRAGPLTSGKQARELERRLDEQGVVVQTRVEDEPVATMHWVSLPPFDTFDAAKKQFAELRARGVVDLGIVNEHPGYIVSLGFYRQRDSARRRHEEITMLGYQPRITERLTTRPVYWLEMRRPAGAETVALTQVITDTLADIPSQAVDCNAVGGRLADVAP